MTTSACDHPDFPLWRHPKGVWAKKIKGHQRYFGSIAHDPTGEQAWRQYKRERPLWDAGLNPREMARQQGNAEITRTLEEIADHWLQHRQARVVTDEKDRRISPRTYDEALYMLRRLYQIVDRGEDPMLWPPTMWERLRTGFGLSLKGQEVSPATKGARIINCRMMFEHALANRLINRLPDWGEAFASVSEGSKEEYRYDYQQEHGQRVFDLEEARAILKAAENAVERAGLNANNRSGHPGVSKRPDGQFEAYLVTRRNKEAGRTKMHLGVFKTALEAANARNEAAENSGLNMQLRMVIGAHLLRAINYLAANTGAYSKDIASIRFQDIDLDEAYLERKRTKNTALWQAVLWPETVVAIRSYTAVRPKPAKPEWAELLFLSSTGMPINRDNQKLDEHGNYHHTNRIDIARAGLSRVLNDMGNKSKGVTFGAWRHTWESLASSAIGVKKEDLDRYDAICRLSARAIPGARDRYVHLKRHQLQPIIDVIREQLWPERVANERQAAKLAGHTNMRLVS